jgi:peptide/nickel transport system substrate-binding protein
VEGLQAGLGSVAHSIYVPNEPEYQEVDQAVVRYEYDPRMARAQLEDLGYRAGPDGALRESSNQQPLGFELRYTSFDLETKTALAVADSWQRAGVAADPVVIPVQRARDREFFATFPAFLVIGNPGNLKALSRLRQSQIPRQENGYVGQNWARYTNPAFDALLSAYFVAIPKSERAALVSQIVHHLTGELIWMSLYYRVDAAFIPNRVRNVFSKGEDSTQAWNAQEWELAR